MKISKSLKLPVYDTTRGVMDKPLNVIVTFEDSALKKAGTVKAIESLVGGKILSIDNKVVIIPKGFLTKG